MLRVSKERAEGKNQGISLTKDVSVASLPGDSELFTIDLRGDRHNLTYGATHRYAVPRFYRAGSGRVLGADERFFIDREHRDTDSLILRMRGDNSMGNARPKTTKVLSGKFNQPAQLYRLQPQDRSQSPLEHEKDYLELDPRAQRYGDGAESGDERDAYRSIHGKAKEEDDIPRGMEPIPDEEARENGIRVDFDADRKARNAELLRAIDSNPTDVASWLQLIDHQGLLILSSGEETRPLTYAERQSVAEVKLSLYDKAIKNVGDSPHKDRLLMGRLHEGAQIWDTERLLSQWKTTLEKNSGCISLWVKYLDFRQTDFRDFAFEQSMAVFIECMNLNASDANNPRTMQIQCYLFLRLTLFLREAGYVELAVGLWQAMLEFTCFQPSSFAENDDLQGALSSFADFWESEVARIGDSGATGWRNGSRANVAPSAHSLHVELDPEHFLTSWSKAERDRILACRLPSRSVDAVDPAVDDPYTVVLYSDLKEILPLFWGLSSSDELVDGFLCFCHLPHLVTPQNILTTRPWSGDNFVRNEYVDNAQSGLARWIPPKENDTQVFVSPFSFSLPDFLHTADTFFAPPGRWFSSFESWASNTLCGTSIINSDWVRRSLRSLVELHTTDDDLAEYALALEFACDREAAKKFAKRLLKTRSSNLRLYNSYALMQWHTGGETTANHVWSTALSMSKDFADYGKLDCGLLWDSWLWAYIWTGDLARATQVLNAIASQTIDLAAFSATSGPVKFTATASLRVQNVLRESQQSSLAHRKGQVYTSYTDCLALFLYLANDSLDAAIEVYASAVSKLRDLPWEEENLKVFTAELLHQARARLLYFHVERKGKFKPSQIHNLLKESISLFPHNTIFLSLFMWNESRFPIFDRIRDVRDLTKNKDLDSRYRLDGAFGLPAASPQNTPISTHIFSIYNELCRPVFTGSTAHSTRAAFEKAIGDHSALASKPGDKFARHTFDLDSARSNLTIWKLYILFELEQNRDIEAAKDVFYRAIRACPWSKELIMLAFERLRDDLIPEDLRRQKHQRKKQPKRAGLGFDELRHLYNVLVEKQLRVHVDIQRDLAEIVAQRSLASEETGIHP